jgi:hypothetical protein
MRFSFGRREQMIARSMTLLSCVECIYNWLQLRTGKPQPVPNQDWNCSLRAANARPGEVNPGLKHTRTYPLFLQLLAAPNG